MPLLSLSTGSPSALIRIGSTKKKKMKRNEKLRTTLFTNLNGSSTVLSRNIENKQIKNERKMERKTIIMNIAEN